MNLSIPTRVTLFYFVVSSIYIFASDYMLLSLKGSDPETITTIQTIKGILFVVLSSLLIFFLTRKYINRLKTSEKQYRHLFYRNPLPLIILNQDQKLLQANDAAQELLQARDNHDLNTIQKHLDNQDFFKEIAEVNGSKKVTINDLQGTEKIILLSRNMIQFDTKAAQLLVMENISERERDKEQIMELNAKLNIEIAEKNGLVKKLATQNRDLEEYAMIISHYLREPVAEVMGLVDYLIEDGEAKEETLYHLRDASNKLDNVTRNMNDTVSSKTYELHEPHPLNITKVVQEAHERMESDLNKAGGKVQYELEDEIMVMGHEHFIRNIITQLFTNAIKFRKEGTPLRIKTTSKCKDDHCLLSISDNGKGFNMEKYGEMLFQLYTRLHKGKSGDGYGLYLVKQQVDMMNGKILVESEEGKGTTFHLQLPMAMQTQL